MVARTPIPEPAESPRELAEVDELEQLVRRRWSEWVERGLVEAMPAWEPMRFRGCSQG